MKFFVSSLISAMAAERTAVIDAIEGLGHQIVRAEDFAASPESPQVACLSAVRSCDALILVAGAGYGRPQASGKSATHEEYDAASGVKPVFIFIDADASPEPKQAAFLSQVQDWQSGGFTARFRSPEELRREVSKSVHQWLIAQSAGTFDVAEARERAISHLPEAQRGYSTGKTRVAVSVAPGPAQAILRPSELEDDALSKHLIREVLTGSTPIFSTRKGTDASIQGHALLLQQDREALSLHEDGSILIVRTLTEGSTGILALIEEDLHDKIHSALSFSASLLDHIDATHRLTHAAIAVQLYEASHLSWRTRAQHAASPNSGSMNMRLGDPQPVTLQPPHVHRGDLRRRADALADDLRTLLRREWTKN